MHTTRPELDVFHFNTKYKADAVSMEVKGSSGGEENEK